MASLALLAALAPPAAAYPRSGATERASLGNGRAQGDADTSRPSLSGDGRSVAFYSSASNLVPGDTNERADVFVSDRQTGAIERISVATDGTQGNAGSLLSSVSADGRLVAFESVASNLVPGDTNATWDVFVHDRESGITERVSVASDGTEGTVTPDERNLAVSGQSHHPSISADGRHVVFYSIASNLAPGDTNRVQDVFVHDRATGFTERVSVGSDGAQGIGASFQPSISADGGHVAFWSAASNLITGDNNGRSDVFVHDREKDVTERVSLVSGGAEPSGHSYVAAISADGRHVAFESWASDLVPEDTNQGPDVFVHDRQTKMSERVSVSADGRQGNNYSFYPSISADGRHVAFYSLASNLVAEDTNAGPDVFVHDRATGMTERASVGADGSQGNSGSASPSLSADGRHVAFNSEASDFVPGDTNGRWDVFVRDRGPSTGVGSLESIVVDREVLVSGWATFSGRIVSSADDPGNDGQGSVGAEITSASITSRIEQEDIVVRWDLASLPSLNVERCVTPSPGLTVCRQLHSGAGAPAVAYRFGFEIQDTRFEVRALRAGGTAVPPEAPYFALYRCELVCTEATRLPGAIGTTGTAVQVSVPLDAMGAGGGDRIVDIDASVAVGEASPGSAAALDEVQLPDASLPGSRVELGIAPRFASEEEVSFSNQADLLDGRFSGRLDVSTLPGGAYRVWARACLEALCDARSLALQL